MNYRLFFLTLITITFLNTAWTNNVDCINTFDSTLSNSVATNPILPNTLTDFGSRKVNEKSFQLFWEIPSDVNFSHFEIEESFANNEFQVIETISYTNSTIQYYSKTVALDTHAKFYRLKMVNQDRTHTYSDLVYVDKLEENTITIAPHDTNADMVNINVSNNKQIKVNIYSISGELLDSQYLNGKTTHQVTLPKTGGETLVFEMIDGATVTSKKVFRI